MFYSSLYSIIMYIRYCIVFVLFISLCLMLLPAQCFDQLTKPPVRQLAIFSKSQNNVESILTTLPAMKLILLNEKYLDKFQDNSTCTTCIENLKIIARNINNKSDNALKGKWQNMHNSLLYRKSNTIVTKATLYSQNRITLLGVIPSNRVVKVKGHPLQHCRRVNFRYNHNYIDLYFTCKA